MSEKHTEGIPSQVHPTSAKTNNAKSNVSPPHAENQNAVTALPNADLSRNEHTSPGTLQDVTMENSYGIGNRSPCSTLQTYQGSTSPATQGRSVREFEEQMATLRKENFNLKLRLYFIEESIPGYQQSNSPESQEALMNQLIDTKVEIEMLRKEVQEKQDLLKDAAQAMTQMELIQKETEAKSQVIVDELNQKIQLLEMEKQMDKSSNNDSVAELLGHSNISENINTIQRIQELEGLLEESNQKLLNFQNQICKLDEILQKRDETIKEYEDKVKELAFQNSELQEALENREREYAYVERSSKGLQKSNAELRNENKDLVEALRTTQNNFRKEMLNMKMYEQQVREQQDALSKMQSIISVKTANTSRLLDRIQEYEKMVTKINFERHMAKRENRFFRAIIGKLRGSTGHNECYSIEKEEIYQQIGSNFKEKFLDITPSNQFEYDKNFREVKACGDFHGEYKFEKKLRVNICNSGRFPSSSTVNFDGGDNHYERANCSGVKYEIGSELPIRYTFSESSLFSDNVIDGGCEACKMDSSSSLHPNFSSSSILAGRNIADEIYIKLENVREELHEVKSMLADKTCLLQEAEEKLDNRTQIHQKACRTIQKLMATITSQQDEINKLKKRNKENISQSSNVSGKEQNKEDQSGLSGLESTGLCRSMSDTEAFANSNEMALMQKEEYENKIEQQKATISSLRAEVKKKTANLQNLVNKELWEKNREIERLTKLINNAKECPPPVVLSPNKENLPLNELQQSFTDSDYLKAVERNKLLQKKIDILIQRLSTNRNNEALITQLRNDVRDARNEAEQAEKWRRECADVCSVLSNRLEELANFLNSLLKHKDVLGLLAADRRRAMRKAVDRSLDLSKSLNMTLSMTGISTNDQSLLQISNLSEILGGHEDRTFNSHEELLQAEGCIGEGSKTVNEEPKKEEIDEHQKRRERHSLPAIRIDNQSESEAWSEPDRNVSMARIGLEDHSVGNSRKTRTPQPAASAETDSESDVINRSRSNKPNPSTPPRSLERIAQLEQIIVHREDRIIDIQCQLVDVDTSLKKENLKVIELTRELDQLRRQNEELEKKVSSAIDMERDRNLYERKENLLRQQIDEKTISLEKIQEERDRLSVEARVAEIQIGALRTELEIQKNKHDGDIAQVREEERQKLELLQAEYKSILDEQQRNHEDILTRNYIARSLYNETQQQLENLKTQLKEAQDEIEYLRENEEEMKRALIDSELANRSFKKELDESAMQASKAVVERTRALNENLQLEKRVSDLNAQLQSVEGKVIEMQEKIDHLEKTRLTLQQELNEANAQLRKLQGSDISRSGYTSEDVVMHNNSSSAAEKRPDPQRQNSSPDLGIESDAAMRNISMELSSAEHQQLKAIELQNNKAEEPIDADSVATKIVERQQPNSTLHDCQKMDQENLELRRKLIRTKRALEDTYEKLRISNQRKAQIEKDIKNQILKTHNVLRNVRSNMENEL